ncbi:response regulator [Frigidibacter sp. MR17.24]|uniref:response regulator n=1 Tax=Frigidibacter sp. MR17.24 TaxID=3127345 RepID=UPI0030130C91
MMEARRPAFARHAKILAIDDDPVALMVIQALLKRLGYDAESAPNGEVALDMLVGDYRPEAILVDREMPGMNGVSFVRELKRDRGLSQIPVIMVTGSDDPEEVREGLDAGVFYYLQKPADVGILASVLAAALRQADQTRQLETGERSTTGFDLAEAAKWRFRTLHEALALAGFIANYFPDPDRSVDGIAALLSNAVEHGICEIGFEAKGRLLEDGRLDQEIRERLLARADRSATVAVQRRDDGVLMIVDDPGKGFDWKDYMTIEMSRSSASHGRGIARARATAFDEIRYNPAGNRVAALMRKDATFGW